MYSARNVKRSGLFAVIKRCLSSRLNDLGKFDASIVKEHFAESIAMRKEQTENTLDTFTIVLPPPNVTGNLHVGHALTCTIEDTICRYQRLLGKKTLWIPGFDHAGIATQTVVEKQIYRNLGKRKEELTDNEFLGYCETWKNERIIDITNQLKSLGCVLDWKNLFYTMEPKFSNAVKVAFCKLYEMGLIVREKRFVQVVGETEPFMKEQWFLHIDKMNWDLLIHLDSGKLSLDPPVVKGSLVEFLKYEEPWNLSRQLLWGHKIPAYLVEKSQRWIVAPSEDEARKMLSENEKHSQLIQDSDVLDTWFSSSLIPIVIAGWPEKELHENVLDLMETGHDIVGCWVARMLMVCQRLTGYYPFSNILMHGMIRDSQNRKMSKSLGNVVDPLDIIEGTSLKRMIDRLKMSNLPDEEIEKAEKDLKKRFPKGMKACGADALRFAMLRHDLTDFHIHIDIPLFAEEGLRFCNKIWNMCKYVEKIFDANNLIETKPDQLLNFNEKDEEIRSKLRNMIQFYCYFMSLNRPHMAFNYLYKFILCDICDSYLESTKKHLWEKDPIRLPAISKTFDEIITISLCLLQTFMPFVSTFLLDILNLDGHARTTKLLQELPKLNEKEYNKLMEEKNTVNKKIAN